MKNIARIGYSFFKIGLYGKVFRLSGKEWILSTKNKEEVFIKLYTFQHIIGKL